MIYNKKLLETMIEVDYASSMGGVCRGPIDFGIYNKLKGRIRKHLVPVIDNLVSMSDSELLKFGNELAEVGVKSHTYSYSAGHFSHDAESVRDLIELCEETCGEI